MSVHSASIKGDINVFQVNVLVTQSCSTLYDPMDCSLPHSSVHGILQARILQWVATPFSKGFSRLKNRNQRPQTDVSGTDVYLFACVLICIWKENLPLKRPSSLGVPSGEGFCRRWRNFSPKIATMGATVKNFTMGGYIWGIKGN